MKLWSNIITHSKLYPFLGFVDFTFKIMNDNKVLISYAITYIDIHIQLT